MTGKDTSVKYKRKNKKGHIVRKKVARLQGGHLYIYFVPAADNFIKPI
jgi:hypothetical protein